MDILAVTPGAFKTHLTGSAIKTYYCQTPAGILQVQATNMGVYATSFIDMQEVPHGQQLVAPDFFAAHKLVLVGTEFQTRVWQAAHAIPAGSTFSYEQLAALIGSKKAYRAVANALGQNKLAYFIPCHRILRKNGELGGFKWGFARKAQLLQAESSKQY